MKQILIAVSFLSVPAAGPLSAQVAGSELNRPASVSRAPAPVSTARGSAPEALEAATERGGQRPLADVVAAYLVADGMTAQQLVDRALTLNSDLLATRERTSEARGLWRQAGLRPNPNVEASSASGSVLGSPGEHELDVGLTQTIELGGKRRRRLDVGQGGVDLALQEVAARERDLAADIKTRYVEALIAVRNLESSARLVDLTEQSYRLAAARVAQGEAAPLEQGLLRVELARLRADRLLFESQVQRALLDLKTLAGLNVGYPLRLRDDWEAAPIAPPPDQLVATALASRPDLAAARREEQVREADVRLAHSEGVPDVTAFVRY
ncbi:MAG: TolC family protein, partial [Acidobacteriota bacterium]